MKLHHLLQKCSFFLIKLAVFQARQRSYETTPKWHGFLMNKLAAFQASGAARVKLHFKSWSWFYPGPLCLCRLG